MPGPILVLEPSAILVAPAVPAIAAAMGVAIHLGFIADAVNPGVTQAHVDAPRVAHDEYAVNEAKANTKIIQKEIMMLLASSSPTTK